MPKKLTREDKIVENFKIREDFRAWVAVMMDGYLGKCDRKGKHPVVSDFIKFCKKYENNR